MVESDPSGSPLEDATAGGYPTEAFELLADETRLAILVALWERYDPFDDGAAVRFSELRERVGTHDSGRFNYHLDRLEGQFVEATGEGYRLGEAGLKLVRSVIAGVGIEDRTLDATEVDTACTLCGGTVAVAYEDGWVHVLCTECDGLWTDSGGGGGLLAKFSLDPAGLADRSPGEIYAAAWIRSFQELYSMIEGVCPTCSARTERWLAICEEHDGDHEGPCPNCGRRLETAALFRCTVCKKSGQMTPGGVAKYHPAVVAFCYDHGLSLQYEFTDLAHITERLETGESKTEQLSADPPRVRVTVEIGDDEISVDLDEDLSVLAVHE